MSACLLGRRCRYDGQDKACPEVIALCERICSSGGSVIPVCPEVMGGLPVPRVPAEIAGGRVVTRDGRDVTASYVQGSERALARIREGGGVPLAVLCAKSPACGVGLVYDGTHSGRLRAGDGVFSRLLREEGMVVTTQRSVSSCKPSVEHPVALVLGTGLGHLAGLVKPVRRIPYRDIEGFPKSAHPASGHSFEATIGTIQGGPVVVYPGRVHLYQGFSALEVTALVRHAYRLGCRVIVFACATGAVRGAAKTGLGIISDHLNLTGTNPLLGFNEGYGELRGVRDNLFDMTDVYTPYLRGIARGVADDLGLEVGEGVLAGVVGPSFETVAEARALKALGASYVGFSTVVEAIMAHALGMQVLGLTLAANYAGDPGISHQSVLTAARSNEDKFERLVCGILKAL